MILAPLSDFVSVAAYSARSTFSAARGGGLFADHLEDVAAVVDLHAQAQLDLAQVFVERPAQVGEAGVVFRVEGEVALVGQ